MTKVARSTKTPRYVEISETLRKDIAAGQYPVGALLPSEAVLCQRFEVSRYTVREALRRLQADGMVSRIQGAGSRILRDTPVGAFVQNYRSVSELTRFAEETRVGRLTTEEVILDARMAAIVGGAPGETWALLRALRSTIEDEPLAFVESYVPIRFADIAPDLARDPGPIYAGLAERAGEVIEHVIQESQAFAAPDNVAEALDLAPGAPTLRILRRYSSASGTLIASFNWHQGGDRYIHRTRIDLGPD